MQVGPRANTLFRYLSHLPGQTEKFSAVCQPSQLKSDPVQNGSQTSKHLQREAEDDEDEEMGLGGPGALEIDDPSQPGHERHATAASKKHHKEDAAAAAKLMREWSDVQLKVSSWAQPCQSDAQEYTMCR